MSSGELLQIIYNAALFGALWAAAIGLGLRFSIRQILQPLTQTRLLVRGVVLNLVVIPLLVTILVRGLNVEPGIAIGLLLLAASAGGPFGLVAAQIARGDAALALALISVLLLGRVVTLPVWLGLVLPFGVTELVQVVGALGLYIALPLAIGLLLKRFLIRDGAKWASLTARLVTVFLASLIGSGILLYRDALTALIVSQASLLILAIQGTSLLLGYWLGGPAQRGRRTFAVTAVVRSSSTALLIAGQVYGALPLVAATVITSGVLAIGVSTLAALLMAHWKVIAPVSGVHALDHDTKP